MLLDLFLNGIAEGSLLALICIGYSLAYGTARVINFAHADVMIAGGGYLVLLWLGGGSSTSTAGYFMAMLFGAAVCIVAMSYLATNRFRVPAAVAAGVAAFLSVLAFVDRLPFVAAAFLALPLTAALASAVYQVMYLPLQRRNAPRTSTLLAALGTSIALQSYLLVAWSSGRRVFPVDRLPDAFTARPVPIGTGRWQAAFEFGVVPLHGDHAVPFLDAVIVTLLVAVAICLGLWFHYSRTADAMIASADAPLAARACGIPVDRITGHAFFLGGAIASIGGTLYVLRSKSLDPTAGFSPGILAFAACVLGGIGSLRGSVAGAFLTALVTSLAPAVPLDQWVTRIASAETIHLLPSLRLSDWSYGVVYMLMILIILVRPRGLFAS